MYEKKRDTVSKATVSNRPPVHFCTKKFKPPSEKVDYTISPVWHSQPLNVDIERPDNENVLIARRISNI